MSRIEMISRQLPGVESLRSRQVIPIEMDIIVPDDFGLRAILSENNRQESLKIAVEILERKIFGTLPKELVNKRFLIERKVNLISPNRNEEVNSGLVRGMVVGKENRNQLTNFEGLIDEVLNPRLIGKMSGVTYQSIPYYETIADSICNNLSKIAPRPQILVVMANGCPTRTEVNYTMVNRLLGSMGDWCPEIWVLPIIRGKGVRVDLDTGLDIHKYWQEKTLGSRYGVIPVYAKPESYNQAQNQALTVSSGNLNLGTLFEEKIIR